MMLCVQLVPLFQDLSLDEQAKLEALLTHHHFHKGETVLAPNQPAPLIILEKGEVKVMQYLENGAERLQKVLKSGDYIGENWLFGQENESIFLEASKDSELCFMRAADFKQLLIQLPSLSYQLLKYTVEHANELIVRDSYLSLSRTEDRLYSYLSDLALAESSDTITLPLALKDLAAYLGTTPETISRMFAKLIKKEQVKKLDASRYQLL